MSDAPRPTEFLALHKSLLYVENGSMEIKLMELYGVIVDKIIWSDNVSERKLFTRE